MVRFRGYNLDAGKPTKDEEVVDTHNNQKVEVEQSDASVREIGKTLKGSPTSIADSVGVRLQADGLAVKVEGGWVRGHKWHIVYGN